MDLSSLTPDKQVKLQTGSLQQFLIPVLWEEG